MSKFNEELAGAIYDLFRGAFSTSMNQNQVDSLHASAAALAAVIVKRADSVALERCKKINDATLKAFEIVAEEVETLQRQADSTTGVLKKLLTTLKEITAEPEAETPQLTEGESDENV